MKLALGTVALALVVGCGQGTATPAAATLTAATGTPTVTASPTPEPVKVSWILTGTNLDAAVARILDSCATETGQPLSVDKIQGETSPAQAIGSVSGYDLFSWFPGYRTRQLVDQGVAAPIGDVWQQFDSTYTRAMERTSATLDGRPYFVPIDVYPWVFMYRKSVFKAHGYAVPATFGQLLSLLKRMHADGLAPMGLAAKDGWPPLGTFDILDMRLNGYQFHTDLMAGKERWTDARVKAVFRAWASLLPYSTRDPGSLVWQNVATSFMSGDIPLLYMGTFALTQTNDPSAANDVGMFPFPVFGNQYDSEKAVDGPVNRGLMLNASSRNPVGAKKILACVARTDAGLDGLLTGSESIAAAKGADTSTYSATQKEAYAIVQDSNAISQFIDRETRPDFAGSQAAGLNVQIGDFLAHPSQNLDAFLARIQSIWDSLPAE